MFKKQFFVYIRYINEYKKVEGYKTALCEYNWLTRSKSSAISNAFIQLIEQVKTEIDTKFIVTEFKVF